MNVAYKDRTVGELVAQRPSRARVFETFGIDYCCHGNQPLKDACAHKQIDLTRLIKALDDNDKRVPVSEERDWTKASVAELIDHIQSTHHAFLKRELPRLSWLVDKVRSVHGERHPELQEVKVCFDALRDDLESHCRKEEDELFPLCLRMVQTQAGPMRAEIARQIQVLEDEHEGAGEALEKLRDLTGGYKLPPDGCNTYRAMLDGLQELEVDLHSHISKENYALYPKAVELARGSSSLPG